jgi:hypothetical protein
MPPYSASMQRRKPNPVWDLQYGGTQRHGVFIRGGS